MNVNHPTRMDNCPLHKGLTTYSVSFQAWIYQSLPTTFLQRLSKASFLEASLKMKKITAKRNVIVQTTENFAARTTVHGISYIFDPELKVVDR